MAYSRSKKLLAPLKPVPEGRYEEENMNSRSKKLLAPLKLLASVERNLGNARFQE